jgi:hypothetical protein
MFDFFW